MSIAGKAIAAALVAALLFVGGGWAGWLSASWRAEAKLFDLKRDHAEQTTRASAAALQRYTELERTKDEAILAHARQAVADRAAADRAHAAAERLRGQLATVSTRIAAASRAAVDEYAATAGELLGQCTTEYQQLAERADGHAADARLMQAAWPK